MENNKSYLRHFGLIFLLFAMVAGLIVWQYAILRDGSNGMFSLFTIIVQILPPIIILAAAGFATGMMRAAVGAILFSVATRLLVLFLYDKPDPESSNHALMFWINQLVYVAPYMFFLLLTKPDVKRILLILVLSLLIFGNNNVFSAIQGIEKLKDLLRIESNSSGLTLYYFAYVLSLVINFILFCELVNYGQGKARGYHPRLLNPGNEYSKLSGTLVFWSLKLYLLLSVIGCSFSLQSFAEYAGREGYSSMGSFNFLKWYYLLNILSTIPLLFCSAWYLRKFMMEFFMSWKQTSRLQFWFFLLPVIGFFGWLIMLFDADRNHTFSERKKSLEDFAASSTNGIATIFMIFLGLRLVLTLSNGPANAILTVGVSAALFYFMLNSSTGYYVNLYLNIFVLGILLLVLFFGKGAGLEFILLLYPLILFNVLQVIMIFPALHIDAFDYISYEEDKPWQPGDDLF
ncbi:MAG: hypothetical protein NTW29_00130 [Bacteroidetes bacterium]|nr:hypothetical protein [Bacteroidota bacterium]